jgi:hypothetical protein
MAKAKALADEVVVDVAEEVVEQPVYVDVEYAYGEIDITYFGGGFRVQFEAGKAQVSEEAAQMLREAQLIK